MTALTSWQRQNRMIEALHRSFDEARRARPIKVISPEGEEGWVPVPVGSGR